MRVVEEHVRGAVHAFFDRPWAVVLAARASARGRRDFRSRLSGPVELKPGTSIPVDGLAEHDVYQLLVARGAPAGCVLIKDGLVDDEITTLASALHRVFLSREGALVSCIPGRLGFLQCDCGRTRLLLHAASPARH